MITKWINQTAIPVLKKSLDVASVRQKVIANNIANITTPGYKRAEVSFEEELTKALGHNKLKGYTTHPHHIPVGKPEFDDLQPKVSTPEDDSLASGVNNVDIDHEMAELAKNQISYSFSARLISRKFKDLALAIRGRAGQ